MNKCIWILLFAGVAAAQAPAPVTYEFKNVDAGKARSIVEFVGQLNQGMLIQYNERFKTAILRPSDNMPAGAIEKAIDLMRRYDVGVQEPKVEFTAYLIRGANRPPRVPAQPMPALLQGALAEMKKNFSYSDYTLLDTVTTEVNHHAQVQSMLGPDAPGWGGAPYFYQIEYGDVVPSADGKKVYIDHFSFSVRIPVNGGNYQSTGITTNISLPEGEKLVIGKVRAGLSDSLEDIFCILTVKLH